MPDLERPTDVQRALRELAGSAPSDPSAAIEARLRAACEARRQRLVMRRMGWWASGVAAACLLVVLGWLSHSTVHPVAAARSTGNESGFIALPYAQSDVPLEQAVVVSVDLDARDMDAMGLTLPAPRSLSSQNKPINADVLIGQDGIARAVRISQ